MKVRLDRARALYRGQIYGSYATSQTGTGHPECRDKLAEAWS